MIVDQYILDDLTAQAKALPRLRMHLDLRNSPEDRSQRILNAIEPGAMMPIHRHRSTSETAVCIRGHFKEYFYDESGVVVDVVDMFPGGVVLNVPAGQWHSLKSLESGTVLLECKDGKWEKLAESDVLNPLIGIDNNMRDYPVTFFPYLRSSVTTVTSLKSVLSDFKNGRYANQIKRVRNVLRTSGEDAYRDAKKSLSAIAFCGEFNKGHGKSDLVRYNNLLVFDIDHLDEEEMIRVRRCLSDTNSVLAFWTSPSGNGFKGVMRINYRNKPDDADLDKCYKKAYADVTSFFDKHYGVHLDPACSDYSRVCYVCWDENLFFNPGAHEFVVDCNGSLQPKRGKPTQKASDFIAKRPEIGDVGFHPQNEKGKNDPRSRRIIVSIIKYLTKRNLSITSTYDEWLRVGFAIASTFNYDLGLKYYLELCKLDGIKYDEEESIKKLKECYIHGSGDIKLGTIIEMAQKKGYQYKGSSEDS